MTTYTVEYTAKLPGTRRTVSRTVTVPATSATIAEAVVSAWLKLQHLKPYSVTAEP